MTAIIVVYLLLLAAAIALSFVAQRKVLRRIAAVASCLMAVPVLFVALAYVAGRIFFGPEPPTVQDLQKQFPKHRTDLETMVRMSNQDSEFGRIAPDFDYRFRSESSDPPSNQTAASQDLPEARWNEYRRIFARNGIHLGIDRDLQDDVFIMVNSTGLLNRGHASGYLYCADNPSLDAGRFEACTSNQTSGSRRFDPNTRAEAYSFIKVADHWYAFDQGPS